MSRSRLPPLQELWARAHALAPVPILLLLRPWARAYALAPLPLLFPRQPYAPYRAKGPGYAG